MQMGTLGAGNHYAEIQVVEQVFDKPAARKMGIDKVGQVCVMIHSGSRGLGHQVKTVSLPARVACSGVTKADFSSHCVLSAFCPGTVLCM